MVGFSFPVEVVAPAEAGTASTGNLDTTGLGMPDDHKKFTLDDGVNAPTVFQLTGGDQSNDPGTVEVDLSGGNFPVGIRNAINGVGASLAITATVAAPFVNLVNDVPGAAGNKAISTTAPGLTVAGMSGGADPASGRRTAPFHFPTV